MLAAASSRANSGWSVGQCIPYVKPNCGGPESAGGQSVEHAAAAWNLVQLAALCNDGASGSLDIFKRTCGLHMNAISTQAVGYFDVNLRAKASRAIAAY